MQKDLCYVSKRRDVFAAAIDPLRRAIDLFSALGHVVLYICFDLQPDDPQFHRFGDTYCISGTPGAEIIDELQPLRGPIVRKANHSAFFETDLDKRLQALGVKNVYLAGLQTQICIMTTAADASFRGYRPVAITDCVISTRAEAKRQALEWIGRYVGDVRPLDSVAEELTHH